MLCTITTCKRPELLKRTLVSFREKALDFESVTKAFVFDDGSEGSDHALMKDALDADGIENVYWFPKEAKTEGGHVASMQRLFEEVGKTTEEFILMLEDDWTLVRSGCPVFAALDVLMNDSRIGQVCLGRDDIIFPGLFRTPTGTGYTIRPPRFGHENLPAFTLNPCVMRVDALRQVGNFEAVEHFESAYGEKWNAAEWLTADLFYPNLHHIGITSAYSIQGRTR